MTLHYFAASTELRLYVPPHRMYSLTLQLPILSGLTLDSSPAMVSRVSWVRNLLDFPVVPRRQLSCTLSIWVLKSVKKFLRIVGIVRLAETFRTLPFVFLSNALVSETVDIDPNFA